MKRNDFGASQEFKTNKAVNLFTPNRALYAVLLIISLLIIVCTRSIPYFDNEKGMRIGIENALVLDNIDTGSFYSTKTKEGGYGEKNTITVFEKMKFCDYICGLDNGLIIMDS